MIDRRQLLLAGALSGSTLPWGSMASPARPERRIPLFGMNIGRKHYDDAEYVRALARLDIAILSFYRGWRGDRDGKIIAAAARSIRTRHPGMCLGQYTVLNEAREERDPTHAQHARTVEIERSRWWLRGPRGEKLQWTDRYNAWDLNFTKWAPVNADGQRYPQWLAAYEGARYFGPGSPFGIWYVDNVMARSRVPSAVWANDGINRPSSDPDVVAAFRQGFVSYWEAIRTAYPDALIVGNTDNDLSFPEYRLRLNGAFLEGLIGRSWSLESRRGWREMMIRYLTVRSNLLKPHITAFNAWGPVADYRRMRYALCSCLLGDGHFCYTDEAAGYSSVPWFDEFEVEIGAPIDDAPTAQTLDQSRRFSGAYGREYSGALVLVNPGDEEVTLQIEGRWRAISGRQDMQANHGRAVERLTLAARDGRILLRALS